MSKANQQESFPVCNKGLIDYLISKGYRLKRTDKKNEYRGIKKDIYYFYGPEKVKKCNGIMRETEWTGLRQALGSYLKL